MFSYQLDEEDSKSVRRLQRETVDDQEHTVETENAHVKKPALDVPPGYSAFKIPRIDANPLSILVHMNINKVLNWDELNEVH